MNWLSFLSAIPALLNKLIDLVYDAVRGVKVYKKRSAAENWETKQNENVDKRIQEILDSNNNKDSNP